MMLSKRVQRSPSNAHISYPMHSELAPCLSSLELLASPPITPPRGQKHSLSKPMTWLNRSTSSASNYPLHAAPKPTRISEPKVGSSLGQFSLHRDGLLGSGATVVRTPQEALFGSAHRPDLTSEEDVVKQDVLLHASVTENHESRLLPPLPPNPPLPPLPDTPDTEGGDKLSSSSRSVSLLDCPPHSSSSPPPAAHPSSLRLTSIEHSRSLSPSVDTNLIPPPPPFEAILLSSIPEGVINPSKLIVTLETCTTTYRTSLRSLVSRPSHLSRYITSLLSPISETASIYSNASDVSSLQHSNVFDSIFRDHLASSGCLSHSTSIHVFLDRPSTPYTHVLAYLRSIPGTPEHPEMLPRTVQLKSMSYSGLEPLFELRDEADYLGLVELEELCCQEIHRFQRSTLPTSISSAPRGHTLSVHSSHTIVEQCQPRQDVRPSKLCISKVDSGIRCTVKSTTRESSSGSLFENDDVPIQEQAHQRGIKYEVGSPPPGWI